MSLGFYEAHFRRPSFPQKPEEHGYTKAIEHVQKLLLFILNVSLLDFFNRWQLFTTVYSGFLTTHRGQ